MFRIEFLNVGVECAQSEDRLRIINKYLPILNPNLVIYGVCINDFLPWAVGNPIKPSISFPSPRSLKNNSYSRDAYRRIPE